MDDKEALVDRLFKRDAKRMELLHQQHKLKDEVNASNEQLDYFCTVFKEKTDKIENSLLLVNSMQVSQLTNHFDNIRSDLRDLQKYFAASSLFLKEFNIRKSQAAIQNLEMRSTELEDACFPKKKFGFRNKKQIRNKKSKEVSVVEAVDTVDSNMQVAKKSWDIVTCGFNNKKNDKFYLCGDNVHKKDVSLSYLTNCLVVIQGNPATLHLTNLSNCIVLSGPVSTSIFLDKCIDCKMALACQQLRFHSSLNCDIYLHVTSKAIVEDCSGIKVAPYNFNYDGLDKDFAMSSLDLNTNNWSKLDDFNWLASDASSPNWKILDENLRISTWDKYIDKYFSLLKETISED